MSYITREIALETCRKMREFYLNLQNVYSESGLDIESDRGRRNIMMSGPMERFLAESIRDAGHVAHHNGATGQPDIVIETDDGYQEIECKLTSPHASSNSVSFQTDYYTLEKKEKLDYVYIVANKTFDGFVFIHFQDLALDDFRRLSNGARGKVQMYKHKGMPKARTLVGEVVNRKEKYLQRLAAQRDEIRVNAVDFAEDMRKQISTIEDLDRKKSLEHLIKNGRVAQTKINKIQERINIVSERNASYSFDYEEIK